MVKPTTASSPDVSLIGQRYADCCYSSDSSTSTTSQSGYSTSIGKYGDIASFSTHLSSSLHSDSLSNNDGEDYLSRRNRRLSALKSGRVERRDQFQNSISKEVGSSSLICMEDHPYYLAQQERKLQALRRNSRQRRASDQIKEENKSSSSSLTNSQAVRTGSQSKLSCADSSEVSTAEAMRDELVAAYQLIHRQRLRIQQLEKQLPQNQEEQMNIPMDKEADNEKLIQSLQDQLIRLHHDKADEAFHLQNRISHETMRFEERLKLLETKAEYWEIRCRNSSEIHESELKSSHERIQALEKALSEDGEHYPSDTSSAANENSAPSSNSAIVSPQLVSPEKPIPPSPGQQKIDPSKISASSDDSGATPLPSARSKRVTSSRCTMDRNVPGRLDSDVSALSLSDNQFADSEHESSSASYSQADFLQPIMNMNKNKKETRKSFFNNATSFWDKAGSLYTTKR